MSDKPIDFPDDATGDALRRLQADGSDMTQPLEIDFHIALPSREAAETFAAEAREMEFTTEVERNEQAQDYTCYCTKLVVPSHANVSDIERTLDHKARRLGGYADGFGSFGNAEP